MFFLFIKENMWVILYALTDIACTFFLANRCGEEDEKYNGFFDDQYMKTVI